jgi:hypothetical protein
VYSPSSRGLLFNGSVAGGCCLAVNVPSPGWSMAKSSSNGGARHAGASGTTRYMG